MELPTQVKEFKSPDINEILPYFLNFSGMMQVIIQFTPCIQPVKSADKKIVDIQCLSPAKTVLNEVNYTFIFSVYMVQWFPQEGEKKDMKIYNMGSLNIDYVYRVPHFVQPGETISSYGREIFAGGKGLNQSIALARAGAQVIHGGMIGPDGAFLKELLEDSGVDTTHICTLQEASGHTVIQVDEQGQNCIILYAGTNHCVTKAYLDELLKDASAGDFMLIQNEINCLNEAMEIAHKKKMYIAFNPSPISKELFTLPLSYVDWWFCNEIEGAILFGKNQKQKMADQIAMDPEKIMQQFQKQYPQSHLILTLGKKGSYYCDKKDIIFQPAFEVKAIDTTAAGDTYSGYFLADLAGGKNISDALKDASLAASICVTRKGAAPSIPYKKEIENLI